MPAPRGIRERPERGIWQGSVWLGGRRYRVKLCTSLEYEAVPAVRRETFLAARYDEARARVIAEGPAAHSAPGQARVAATWQEWIRACEPLRAAGTLDYYTRTGNELVGLLGDVLLSALDLRAVDRLIGHWRGRGLGVVSINIRLQVLAAFLRWCHERGLVGPPPRIRQLRRERRLPRLPSDDQLAAWLRMLKRIARRRNGQPPVLLPNGTRYTPGAAQRLSARRREWFLRVTMDTGLRLSEFVHTPLEQYDTDSGMLEVRFQPRFNIKEGREKRIPLTRRVRRLVVAIRRVHPGWRYFLDDGSGRIGYSSAGTFADQLVRDLVALGLAAAGIKPAHSLRALFAHRLREAGVDRATIRDLMGHSDIRVTDTYLPASDTPGRAAIDKLEDH